jgi:hypothetical protein
MFIFYAIIVVLGSMAGDLEVYFFEHKHENIHLLFKKLQQFLLLIS